MEDFDSCRRKRIEEEVAVVLEQAKELQDSAASLIFSASKEEQSLRQRSAALDSAVHKLRSSIDSLVFDEVLNPKFVVKLDEKLNSARCIIADGDASSFLPSKAQGRFMKMFIGPINVRATRKDMKLKVKEEYNRFKVYIQPLVDDCSSFVGSIH